jgi:uncharacterized protein (UPF0305 family)
MTHAKRMMHLAIQAAAPGHPAGWRLPGGKRQANEDVAHYPLPVKGQWMLR